MGKTVKIKRVPRKNRFLGLPMNWDLKRAFTGLWNPKSDEIFPPKAFGIGWSVNFHALLRAIGFVRGRRGGK